jgi:hypothetical protein
MVPATTTVVIQVPGSPNASKVNEIVRDKVAEAISTIGANESLAGLMKSVVGKLTETVKDTAIASKLKRDDAYQHLEKTADYYLKARSFIEFIPEVKSVKLKSVMFDYIDVVLQSDSSLSQHLKTFESWGKTQNDSDTVKMELTDVLIDIMFALPEFIGNMEKIMAIVRGV